MFTEILKGLGIGTLVGGVVGAGVGYYFINQASKSRSSSNSIAQGVAVMGVMSTMGLTVVGTVIGGTTGLISALRN